MQKTKSRLMRAAFMVMALLTALGMFAGCSARVTNPTVMIAGDVDISFNAYKDAYYYCYQAYNSYQLYNVSTSEKIKEFQDIVFDYIAEYALTANYAKQAGIELDETELAYVDTMVATSISGIVANYAAEAKTALGETATEEQIAAKQKELFSAALASSTGLTYDEYVEDTRNTYILKQLCEKYKAELVKDANVPEEDIKSYYDELVEQNNTLYESSPAQYFTDYTNYQKNGGVPPLAAPAGYGRYKFIYVAAPAEGEEKDTAAIIAEVQQKLAEGMDFDEAISVFNEDESMNTAPYDTEGILMSEYNTEVYLEEFLTACMALKNAGDVSEPLVTDAGTYIFKRIADVSTEPTPVEEVRDSLYNELLYLAQLKIFKDKVAEWTESTEINRYYARVASYVI